MEGRTANSVSEHHNLLGFSAVVFVDVVLESCSQEISNNGEAFLAHKFILLLLGHALANFVSVQVLQFNLAEVLHHVLVVSCCHSHHALRAHVHHVHSYDHCVSVLHLLGWIDSVKIETSFSVDLAQQVGDDSHGINLSRDVFVEQELRGNSKSVHCRFNVRVVGISTDQNETHLDFSVSFQVVFQTEDVIATVSQLVICQAVLLQFIV